MSTMLINPSKLRVATSLTMFRTIINLPAFQIIEQFASPEKKSALGTRETCINRHITTRINQKRHTYRICWLKTPNPAREPSHPFSRPPQSTINHPISVIRKQDAQFWKLMNLKGISCLNKRIKENNKYHTPLPNPKIPWTKTIGGRVLGSVVVVSFISSCLTSRRLTLDLKKHSLKA